MKPFLCALLLLLLSGCKLDPYADLPKGATDWYGEGIDDGRTGVKPRSDDMLASDLDDPKVNRPLYLKGYAVGLDDICQAHLLFGWGVSGKIYPEGCDSKSNAKELREAWDKGMKEGAQSTLVR
ncbi:MAG: DUF2799 domain-containing protein [Scandinavium sp.]|uniref:DUF2799 domain-containing protein n=1 Tax=Scandinavium sp. TaxID=2830653 RepID=UPI003F333FB0